MLSCFITVSHVSKLIYYYGRPVSHGLGWINTLFPLLCLVWLDLEFFWF